MSFATSTAGSSQHAQAVEPQPTPHQILFARALILTFRLWPVFQMAVSEEWGGPESADKRDFLVEHLVDLYGGTVGTSMDALDVQAKDLPRNPDVDDLADILDGYFQDEFDQVHIEEEMIDSVVLKIRKLHKTIFVTAAEDQEAALSAGQVAVQQLEQAALKLGVAAPAVQGWGEGDDVLDSEDEENEDGDIEMDGTSEGNSSSANGASASHQRAEPEVDEEGFTTVVSRRR